MEIFSWLGFCALVFPVFPTFYCSNKLCLVLLKLVLNLQYKNTSCSVHEEMARSVLKGETPSTLLNNTMGECCNGMNGLMCIAKEVFNFFRIIECLHSSCGFHMAESFSMSEFFLFWQVYINTTKGKYVPYPYPKTKDTSLCLHELAQHLIT